MESRQPTPINGRLNQQYPPEAVIRALAKFFCHDVFTKSRADYQPSHETQSRHRRAIYARAAALANPT
ncbi:MAG: hypothetical protein WAM90_18155, partial [Rhodanobacter sp.]